MTYGFIGTGNMGGALATALAKHGETIYLSNRTRAKAEVLSQKIGGTVVDNVTIAETCDFIFLGVKPQRMPETLNPLKTHLSQRSTPFVLVSMAASLTIAAIQEMAGGNYPVIRIMPNTACAVGAGMTLYCSSENVSENQLQTFLNSMEKSGELEELPESLIDAGSAVAGCGGAYACLFLEGLADGGVSIGLPREKAMRFARQMLMGTALLAKESGQHPGQMKDAICSPGGTTIAGVRALENRGFRAAAMEAVIAAYNRTQELKK